MKPRSNPTPFRFGARLVVAALGGAFLGLGVAVFSPGPLWAGWLAASALAVPAVFILLSAWAWAGGGKLLAWMIALAFLLRLVAGVGLSLALPEWGYPEPNQRAGYLFKDAGGRDQQAWELARSERPLYASFRDEFFTDQYGGLLALSALVYRWLSPDAHRPFLILILGAFVAALGLPFLIQAGRLRWPARATLIAGWIYVFYPDAIFFAASQMREPFLVGLGTIALWAVLAWSRRSPATWLALAASLAGMAVISNRVAAATAGFLGLLFLLEYGVDQPQKQRRVLGWIGLVVGAVFLLAFSWDWFTSSASWDIQVTGADSGWVDKLVEEASEMVNIPKKQLYPPVIVAYGLARPVLPAAIAEPSIPLWQAIGIFRSAGWYALAPFLLYALFSVWKEPDRPTRRRLIWLAVAVMLWLIISSARGGGDVTDNPRYRSLFISWFALLAGWAIDWALAHRDPWLWRWIAVEIIFLGFFTNWYFSRYFKIWRRMYFWEMAGWITGLSALVLVGGWIWDRLREGNGHIFRRSR